jgi:hypothetical protein
MLAFLQPVLAFSALSNMPAMLMLSVFLHKLCVLSTGCQSGGAALRYAFGECNYGGRVTDDKDRRLLMAALGRVYRPEILAGTPDSPFALSASGTYTVPPGGNHAAYLAHIAALPVFALPEVWAPVTESGVAHCRHHCACLSGCGAGYTSIAKRLMNCMYNVCWLLFTCNVTTLGPPHT